MARLAKILIFLLFIPSILLPQDKTTRRDTSVSYNAFWHYQHNWQYASFTSLPDIKGFDYDWTNSDGNGFGLGLMIEWNLPYNFKAGLRGGMNFLDNEMRGSGKAEIMKNGEDIGITDNILKTHIAEFIAESYISYEVLKGLNLHAGGHMGFLNFSRYEFSTQITDPRGAQFADTSKSYLRYNSEALPDASEIYGAILLGISYELPGNLLDEVTIVPEVFYLQGLSSLATKHDWNMNSLRIGISIKYNPPVSEPESKTRYLREEHIDTVEIKSLDVVTRHVNLGKPLIDTTRKRIFDSVYYTEHIYRTDTLYLRPKPTAYLQSETDTVRITSKIVTEVFPLLDYIFFEKESDLLAEYYIEPDSSFNIADLSPDPVNIQKNVLNILSFRLRKYPKAKITLTGAVDTTSETGGCTLAEKRVLKIKKLLIENWGIKSDRIQITPRKDRCYPSNPTLTQNERGFSENRRVEVNSTSNDILSLVIIENFNEIDKIEPESINLNTDGTTEKGLADWTLLLKSNNKILSEKHGSSYEKNLRITIANDATAQCDPASPLLFEYYVEDTDGQTAMDRARTTIVIDTIETDHNRISVVLFEIRSAKITPKTKEYIKTHISNYGRGGTYKITGYTDILGDQEQNKLLSQQRAENTAAIIKKLDPTAKIEKVKGIATDEYPPGINSYSTPIDRYLSRIVLIEVIR